MSGMTIGRKLNLSFGAMLAMTAALGGISLLSLERMNETLDNTANKVARRMDLAGGMQSSVALMRAGQRGVVLYSVAKDQSKARESDEMFRSAARRLEEQLNEFAPLVATEEGRKSVAAIRSDREAWASTYEEIARRALAQQTDAELYTMIDKGGEYGQQMSANTEKLLGIQRKF